MKEMMMILMIIIIIIFCTYFNKVHCNNECKYFNNLYVNCTKHVSGQEEKVETVNFNSNLYCNS